MPFFARFILHQPGAEPVTSGLVPLREATLIKELVPLAVERLSRDLPDLAESHFILSTVDHPDEHLNPDDPVEVLKPPKGQVLELMLHSRPRRPLPKSRKPRKLPPLRPPPRRAHDDDGEAVDSGSSGEGGYQPEDEPEAGELYGENEVSLAPEDGSRTPDRAGYYGRGSEGRYIQDEEAENDEEYHGGEGEEEEDEEDEDESDSDAAVPPPPEAPRVPPKRRSKPRRLPPPPRKPPQKEHGSVGGGPKFGLSRSYSSLGGLVTLHKILVAMQIGYRTPSSGGGEEEESEGEADEQSDPESSEYGGGSVQSHPGLTVPNHRAKGQMYRDVFSGDVIVEWLGRYCNRLRINSWSQLEELMNNDLHTPCSPSQAKFHLTESQIVQFLNALLHQNYLSPVKPQSQTMFANDSKSLYRFSPHMLQVTAAQTAKFYSEHTPESGVRHSASTGDLGSSRTSQKLVSSASHADFGGEPSSAALNRSGVSVRKSAGRGAAGSGGGGGGVLERSVEGGDRSALYLSIHLLTLMTQAVVRALNEADPSDVSTGLGKSGDPRDHPRQEGLGLEAHNTLAVCAHNRGIVRRHPGFREAVLATAALFAPMSCVTPSPSPEILKPIFAPRNRSQADEELEGEEDDDGTEMDEEKLVDDPVSDYWQCEDLAGSILSMTLVDQLAFWLNIRSLLGLHAVVMDEDTTDLDDPNAQDFFHHSAAYCIGQQQLVFSMEDIEHRIIRSTHHPADGEPQVDTEEQDSSSSGGGGGSSSSSSSSSGGTIRKSVWRTGGSSQSPSGPAKQFISPIKQQFVLPEDVWDHRMSYGLAGCTVDGPPGRIYGLQSLISDLEVFWDPLVSTAQFAAVHEGIGQAARQYTLHHVKLDFITNLKSGGSDAGKKHTPTSRSAEASEMENVPLSVNRIPVLLPKAASPQSPEAGASVAYNTSTPPTRLEVQIPGHMEAFRHDLGGGTLDARFQHYVLPQIPLSLQIQFLQRLSSAQLRREQIKYRVQPTDRTIWYDLRSLWAQTCLLDYHFRPRKGLQEEEEEAVETVEAPKCSVYPANAPGVCVKCQSTRSRWKTKNTKFRKSAVSAGRQSKTRLDLGEAFRKERKWFAGVENLNDLQALLYPTHPEFDPGHPISRLLSQYVGWLQYECCPPPPEDGGSSGPSGGGGSSPGGGGGGGGGSSGSSSSGGGNAVGGSGASGGSGKSGRSPSSVDTHPPRHPSFGPILDFVVGMQDLVCAAVLDAPDAGRLERVNSIGVSVSRSQPASPRRTPGGGAATAGGGGGGGGDEDEDEEEEDDDPVALFRTDDEHSQAMENRLRQQLYGGKPQDAAGVKEEGEEEQEEEEEEAGDAPVQIPFTELNILRCVEEGIWQWMFPWVFHWYQKQHRELDLALNPKRRSIGNSLTLRELGLNEFFWLQEWDALEKGEAPEQQPYATAIQYFQELDCSGGIVREDADPRSKTGVREHRLELRVPHLDLRIMKQVVQAIGDAVSVYWQGLEQQHQQEDGARKQGLRPLPRSRRNLAADDIIMIACYVISRIHPVDSHPLSGIIALTALLADYVEAIQSVGNSSVARQSAVEWYDGLGFGHEAFSLTNIQASLHYFIQNLRAVKESEAEYATRESKAECLVHGCGRRMEISGYCRTHITVEIDALGSSPAGARKQTAAALRDPRGRGSGVGSDPGRGTAGAGPQSSAVGTTGLDADALHDVAPLPKKKAPRGLLGVARGLVSKKKQRFQEAGFDLDLSYITPRILAMGFPSTGVSAMYRNPLNEVKRFFSSRHGKAFKVYNLCSERSYKAETFEGECAYYPFDDHNPPPFEILITFCQDVEEFLKQDASNVVAIHCKAGKGRTGTVISCYLVYSGLAESAKQALEFFGRKRTRDGQGVTIPSQRRYVGYFERYLREYRSVGKPFPPPLPFSPSRDTLHHQHRSYGVPLVLTKIRIFGAPVFNKDGGCNLSLVCFGPYPKREVIFDQNKAAASSSSGQGIVGESEAAKRQLQQEPRMVHIAPGFHTNFHEYVDLHCGAVLMNDVKFCFYHEEIPGRRPKKPVFWLWVHTAFLDNHIGPDNPLRLRKTKVDKAVKDKECKHFRPDFAVELYFERPPVLGLKAGWTLQSRRARKTSAGSVGGRPRPSSASSRAASASGPGSGAAGGDPGVREKSRSTADGSSSRSGTIRRSSSAPGPGGGAGSRSPGKLIPGEFDRNLRHRLSYIDKQVEAGLYSCKRLGLYVKKVCHVWHTSSRELLQVSLHEMEKKYDQDAMTQVVEACRKVHMSFCGHATDMENMAGHVQKHVVEPLIAFHASGVKKLQQFRERNTVRLKKIQQIHDLVEKERRTCIKAWQALQTANRKIVTAHRVTPKLRETYDKVRRKAEEAFGHMEQILPEQNRELKRLEGSSLTNIVTDYESLELERLKLMDSSLRQLSLRWEQEIKPLASIVTSMKQEAEAVDLPGQISGWLEDARSEYGSPKDFAPLKAHIPCASEAIARDDDHLKELLAEDVSLLIEK